MKAWIACLCLSVAGGAVAEAAVSGKESPAAVAGGAGEAGQELRPGRYQLVVVPTHEGSPFLIDTATGCIWHQIQDKETRRTTFVEVDVNNLHWSWGSGAQSIIVSRIDASSLDDKQKKALKEGLQKTACGLSSVVLTPGAAHPGQAPKTP